MARLPVLRNTVAGNSHQVHSPPVRNVGNIVTRALTPVLGKNQNS